MTGQPRARPRITARQREYLEFIVRYIDRFGIAPAELDIARHFLVEPPSAHLMVVALEKRGLISRVPGRPRSITVQVPREELLRATATGSAGPFLRPADLAAGVACRIVTLLSRSLARHPRAELEAILADVLRALTEELAAAGVGAAESAAAHRRVAALAEEERGEHEG